MPGMSRESSAAAERRTPQRTSRECAAAIKSSCPLLEHAQFCKRDVRARLDMIAPPAWPGYHAKRKGVFAGHFIPTTRYSWLYQVAEDVVLHRRYKAVTLGIDTSGSYKFCNLANLNLLLLSLHDPLPHSRYLVKSKALLQLGLSQEAHILSPERHLRRLAIYRPGSRHQSFASITLNMSNRSFDVELAVVIHNLDSFNLHELFWAEMKQFCQHTAHLQASGDEFDAAVNTLRARGHLFPLDREGFNVFALVPKAGTLIQELTQSQRDRLSYRPAAVDFLNVSYPLITASTRKSADVLARCKAFHSHLIKLLSARFETRDNHRLMAILDDVKLSHHWMMSDNPGDEEAREMMQETAKFVNGDVRAWSFQDILKTQYTRAWTAGINDGETTPKEHNQRFESTLKTVLGVDTIEADELKKRRNEIMLRWLNQRRFEDVRATLEPVLTYTLPPPALKHDSTSMPIWRSRQLFRQLAGAYLGLQNPVEANRMHQQSLNKAPFADLPQGVRAEEQFFQASIELHLNNHNEAIRLYTSSLAIWQTIDPACIQAASANFQIAYAKSLVNTPGVDNDFKQCLIFCNRIAGMGNREALRVKARCAWKLSRWYASGNAAQVAESRHYEQVVRMCLRDLGLRDNGQLADEDFDLIVDWTASYI